MNLKIQSAIEIFKANFPELIGTGRKFRPMVSQTSGNVVEILEDGILYCTINIKSEAVKGI